MRPPLHSLKYEPEAAGPQYRRDRGAGPLKDYPVKGHFFLHQRLYLRKLLIVKACMGDEQAARIDAACGAVS